MAIKTAIEEIMDIVEMDAQNCVEISMRVFHKMLSEGLKKEKQQIKDAFNQGYRDGELDAESNTFDGDVSEFSNAYDYYFQTYGGGDE